MVVQIFFYLIFVLFLLISTIAFVLLPMRKKPRRHLALSLVLCLSLMVSACSLMPSDENSKAHVTTPTDNTGVSISNSDGQSTNTDVSPGESSETQAHSRETTETTSTEESSKSGSEPTSTDNEMPGDTMTLHFLDVGQGAGTLVQLGSRVMLIDGGGPEASSFVVAYLLEQGISTIDVLIATHYAWCLVNTKTVDLRPDTVVSCRAADIQFYG